MTKFDKKGKQPSFSKEKKTLNEEKSIDNSLLQKRQENLSKSGFSRQEICLFKIHVPDLNMAVVELNKEKSFTECIERARDISSRLKLPVVARAQGVPIIITLSNDVIVIEDFGPTESASNPYCSMTLPHSKHDPEEKLPTLLSHLTSLKELSFDDAIAPLEWLCTLQKLGGTGVSKKTQQTVLDAFLQKGYRMHLRLEDNLDPQNPDAQKRFIISEALKGIKENGCPSSLILDYVSQYVTKFKFC